MIFESTSNLFDEDINKSKYVIVEFFATWCNSCKILKNVFDTFSNKVEQYSEIKLFSMNIDEFPDISTKYKITMVPTLLYFKNGKLFERSVGLVSEENIIEVLNKMKNL